MFSCTLKTILLHVALAAILLNPIASGFQTQVPLRCKQFSSKHDVMISRRDKNDYSLPQKKQKRSLLLALPPSLSAFTIPTKDTVNIIAIIGGSLILSVYHILLWNKERQGQRTWRSAQADIREQWSKYVRQNEQWLYAIQTLRNAITAQTFLATTVLSLLTVIAGRLWDIIRNISSHQLKRRMLIAQFSMFTLTMLSSAYYFLQSARLMTHAGFMFPVFPQKTKVDRIMRKTEHSQWLGLRCLYLSVAFLSWVAGGPNVFLFASALLVAFFRRIDRVPEEIANDYTFDI